MAERNIPVGPMLALDTSTATLAVGLVDGNQVIAEQTIFAERNHSVRLLPAIDELMRTVGLSPRDLRAVAVGGGPGSYTGVRIGVTMAKTFAWALGLPVYKVSTLEALALGGWLEEKENTSSISTPVWIIPALDARRGQAYTALFAAGEKKGAGQSGDGFSGISRISEDAVLPFQEQADAWLRSEHCPATVLFVGEIDGKFAGLIDAVEGSANTVVLRRPCSVRARDIAALALLHGKAALEEDARDLTPNYAQPTEAEVKLKAAAEAEAKERELERS